MSAASLDTLRTFKPSSVSVETGFGKDGPESFRDFILNPRTLQLLVALILGVSIAPVVSTFVQGIMLPFIGSILANVDLSTWKATIPVPGGRPPIVLEYGQFLGAVVTFLLTALILYFLVKIGFRLYKFGRRDKGSSSSGGGDDDSVNDDIDIDTSNNKYLREIRDEIRQLNKK